MLPFAVVAVAFTVFSLFMLLSFLDYASAYGNTPGGVPFGFGLLAGLLLLWMIISFNTPVERESRPLTVSTVDNVDITVDGSKIINLNEEFDRDFEPDDKVYAKSGVWAGGLWYEGHYSTKE